MTNTFVLAERDAAIAVVVQSATRYIVGKGAELAQIAGPDLAAEITAGALGELAEAFDILGISRDDIERVGRQLDALNDFS